MREKWSEEEEDVSPPRKVVTVQACGSSGRRPRNMLARSFSETSSAGYESAIIGEAHGLITDMLADSNLPPHIISGLRAVSNLLKPPEAHGSFHKPRVSPLVSLTETSCGSDNEESPYTGERPSSLPKRLRRSLPPSLIRRMSTSTWTTTTSATGMPTLEPEPCRLRSASFRHSREGTPGSSPSGSRSNSPSPSTNTTVVLTIPKSRSFSLASATAPHTYQRRLARKSLAADNSSGLGSGSGSSAGATTSTVSPTARFEPKALSPLMKPDMHPSDAGEGGGLALGGGSAGKEGGGGLLKQRLITSDYESSDSPNSSDLSDNMGTTEDGGMSAMPRKESLQRLSSGTSQASSALEGDMKRLSVKEEEEEETTTTQRRRRSIEAEEEKEEKGKEAVVEGEEEEEGQDVLDSGVIAGAGPVALFTQEDIERSELLQISRLNDWDFPIFDLADQEKTFVLSKVAYKLFTEVGLMETFRIPVIEFINYFHALELGYRDKPYHNRVHATDVLHGVYYLTTRPIPGFTQINTVDACSRHGSSSESENEGAERSFIHRTSFLAEDTYGIMGGNIPALELMALYTAAAMHDYDHPGRTNAFLVSTHAAQAVLYNDRAVLENHHAASAWSLLLHNPNNNFLTGLEAAEFKRFRFLVIEAILATDLKRHFEILAEFNAKVNDDDAPGVDWTVETDRLLILQMVIKLADINGPAKVHPLHFQWTMRIAEEFYEQGDEEASLGMPISPYMDRRAPQLAKLQETFINHLVAPLCNAMVTGGLLPGTWVEEGSDDEGESDMEKGDSTCKDTEDDDEGETDTEAGPVVVKQKRTRKVNCLLTKNMKDNYEHWSARIKEEAAQKAAIEAAAEAAAQMTASVKDSLGEKSEMEPIKEESESPPPSSTSLRGEETTPSALTASSSSTSPSPTPAATTTTTTTTATTASSAAGKT
ncbi:cGMP-inhibited 3',5'-cyclic phosphodiesterase 3A-like isoform X3 [Babylonia areolata]|uniref:cGMP-inhibited 3',5'-cyclic phosphodiesterase 3A-like isoform X3 n=1 Tax=Babylonia areolata TaxID=304850 RepID=UPI003FD69724